MLFSIQSWPETDSVQTSPLIRSFLVLYPWHGDIGLRLYRRSGL